jgi:hypothetical protein
MLERMVGVSISRLSFANATAQANLMLMFGVSWSGKSELYTRSLDVLELDGDTLFGYP